MKDKTRNSELLESFTAYCQKYPDLRFWQALRNWCGWNFVLVAEEYRAGPRVVDTFPWEENRPPEQYVDRL